MLKTTLYNVKFVFILDIVDMNVKSYSDHSFICWNSISTLYTSQAYTQVFLAIDTITRDVPYTSLQPSIPLVK